MAERHIAVALCLWLAHAAMTTSPAFAFVFHIATWRVWLGIYAVLGLAAWTAKRMHSDVWTRALGVVSMVLAAVWAINFAMSFAFDHDKVAALYAVLFAYMARKDFIVLGLPFSPEWDERIERRLADRIEG